VVTKAVLLVSGPECNDKVITGTFQAIPYSLTRLNASAWMSALYAGSWGPRSSF
jgi:hypothetical protein